MAKIYSLMSWNVEHFKKKTQYNQTQQRIDRISAQIRSEDPDVFAIYEVEDKQTPDEKDDWIHKYSDHCYLYLEVHSN